jgi:hypothetical protein
MDKHIGKIVGILFGIGLVVVAILKPSFAWNFEGVMSIRRMLGETLTMVALIGAGIVIAGSSLLFSRART